jgi:general secretion pathway protein M
MKAWWRGLSLREQRILLIGAAVVFVMLFYAYVVQPIYSRTHTAYAQLQRELKTLTFTEHAVRRMRQFEQQGYRPVQAATGQPLTWVKQALAGELVQSYSKVTGDEHEVSLSVTNVPFDRLMSALQSLMQKDALVVKTAKFTRASVDGLANGRCVLVLATQS